MTRKHTVLVVGMGGVGFGVVRELSRLDGVRAIACRRTARAGVEASNLLTLFSETIGANPDIAFEPLDAEDADRIEALLRRYEPDVVFQCATALPYWRIERLPEEVRDDLLSAGLGWTAPTNLQYPMTVAEAVDDADLGERPLLVNASIPDYTNVVLSRVGLPYDCGIGNVGGGRIPMLERGAAKRLGEPHEDVSVFAGFPHAVAANLRSEKRTGGLPYFLRVFLRGEDVTATVDPDGALADPGWPELPDLPPTGEGYPLAVASSTAVVRAMLYDTNDLLHVPGPNGLPGGWPCRANGGGVEVVLPSGTDEAEVREINEAGLAGEGIESIEDDGTIVYTDEARRLVEDAIGYDCERLAVDEVEDRRRELEQKLQAVDAT